MEKIKPYVEQILYENIIPILFVTSRDLMTFENDPAEFIRKQDDYVETMYDPKNQIQNLLENLCTYSSQKKGKKPDYLHKFLEFVVKNLNEYNEQVKANPNTDWRIKEALMCSIGTLREQIRKQKDLKGQMEQMLIMYIMPELQHPHPSMRLRACQTYGLFEDLKLTDEKHIQSVCEAIFKNMDESQALPVRFYAACALEKVLRLDEAKQYIKSGLSVMLKCYLALINEFDNEELVRAFENIMQIFDTDIGPYAIEICGHLKEAYLRQIKADEEDENNENNFGESILAACGTLSSIKRILEAIEDDPALLKQVEQIIHPVLLHSTTADGFDTIEEGIECITIII